MKTDKKKLDIKLNAINILSQDGDDDLTALMLFKYALKLSTPRMLEANLKFSGLKLLKP